MAINYLWNKQENSLDFLSKMGHSVARNEKVKKPEGELAEIVWLKYRLKILQNYWKILQQ